MRRWKLAGGRTGMCQVMDCQVAGVRLTGGRCGDENWQVVYIGFISITAVQCNSKLRYTGAHGPIN